MIRTTALIICLVFALGSNLTAQVDSVNTKGMVVTKKKVEKGVTRAVLVGVSDYENESIPDLKYADKDVEVYYNFLRSKAGGSLEEENIKLLTNEKATGGNVHKALYWLVKESQEGDQCIIYFSGHGDVETIYPDEPGHLLVYDSPSSIYQINSLRLEDLKRTIRTLSEQKKSKVFLFADACRSGKLAGTEVSGAQATSAALATQFSNEIKIMSCQPDEYSIEGIEWGGGRGLFSYHFVEGLSGLADTDHDNAVSLKEIQRYLEDRFDEDLSTQTQTPLVMGNRNLEIAQVDDEILAALLASKNANPTAAIASIDQLSQTRGQNDQDDLLTRFYEALDKKVLLVQDESTTEKSAEYYFQLISERKEFRTKAALLKGDLIFALQDEANGAINRYLNVDYQEMLNRYKGVNQDYERYPIYLAKAAELLTESHYLYPQMKAKEIYFSVVQQRLQLTNQNYVGEDYNALEDDIVQALLYDPNAAYLWNELGLLQKEQDKHEDALLNFEKALEKSPTWPLPYQNIAHLYWKTGKYRLAIEQCNKALDLNPSFTAVYANLSQNYQELGELDKAINCDLKLIEKFQNDYCYFYEDVGVKYHQKGNLDTALEYYSKAIACDSNFVNSYINASLVFCENEDYASALEILHQIPNSRKLHADVFYQFAWVYQLSEEYEKAVEAYAKAIGRDSSHYSNFRLASLYLQLGRVDESITLLQNYVTNIDPSYSWAYYKRACAYATKEEYEAFQIDMQKAIDLGFSSLESYENNEHLEKMRERSDFQHFLMLLQNKN